MIDVWQIDLKQEADMASLLAVLDEREKNQAGRFRHAHLARNYIVAHAATRFILCNYMGISAQEICFEYNAYGKPSIIGHGELFFNISHSDDMALCGVASAAEIGVDIERRRALDWRAMARRFFSPVERDFFNGAPGLEMEELFFACWTRKEAYIKAKGLGLSLPLDSFSVECRPGRPAALTGSARAPDDVGRFGLWEIALAGGEPTGHPYKAALAYAGGPGQSPACRQWSFALAALV